MNPVAFLVKQFRDAPTARLFVRSLALGNKGGNSSVTASDGTAISVRQSGQGEPLVLVHGTLDSMSTWSFVEPALSEDFAVTVYDRRGRGGSGDTMPYQFEREVEDLLAVLDSITEPVHVVGHSFGAVVAMKARLSGAPMRSLVLYEPPINGDEISATELDEIIRLVEADRADDAIQTMAQNLAGVSDDELSTAMSVPPVRNGLREGVRAAGREIAALRSITWTDLPILDTPTMVLRGALTNVAAYPSKEQAATLAEDITVSELAGQGHLGHTFDAPAFIDVIRNFARRH